MICLVFLHEVWFPFDWILFGCIESFESPFLSNWCGSTWFLLWIITIEYSRWFESLASNERRYFILSLPFTFQTSVLLVWCFSEYYYWIVVCSLVTWITNWDWIIQSIIFIINNPVSSSLLDSSYSISLTLIQCLLVRSVEILNLFVLVALVEDLYVWFMFVEMVTVRAVSEERHKYDEFVTNMITKRDIYWFTQ